MSTLDILEIEHLAPAPVEPCRPPERELITEALALRGSVVIGAHDGDMTVDADWLPEDHRHVMTARLVVDAPEHATDLIMNLLADRGWV